MSDIANATSKMPLDELIMSLDQKGVAFVARKDPYGWGKAMQECQLQTILYVYDSLNKFDQDNFRKAILSDIFSPFSLSQTEAEEWVRKSIAKDEADGFITLQKLRTNHINE